MKPDNLHQRLTYPGLAALIPDDPEKPYQPVAPVLIYFEPQLEDKVCHLLTGELDRRFQWMDFTIREWRGQADHLERWLNGDVHLLNHGLAHMKDRPRDELQRLVATWRRWVSQLVKYWNYLVTLKKKNLRDRFDYSQTPCFN